MITINNSLITFNNNSKVTIYSGAGISIATITIDYTKVDSNQTDFPILISGIYPLLKTVANGGKVQNLNGYDIVFYSDSNLTTKLKFEIEKWDGTTGELISWIKIPSLSSTVDTTIYLAYGDSSITTDQSDPINVWDNNFKRVYHLKENAANTTVVDSTGNENAVSQRNTSLITTTGKIDGAFSYNGSSDYQNFSITPVTGSTSFTMECWARRNGTGARLQLLQTGQGTTANDGTSFYFGAGGKLQFDLTNTAGCISTTTVADNTLHHCVIVNDASTFQLYVDGNPDGSNASLSPNIINGIRNYIGVAWYGTLIRDYWNDLIDEVRISNNARSASWIKTTYNTQNSPSTFYSISF